MVFSLSDGSRRERGRKQGQAGYGSAAAGERGTLGRAGSKRAGVGTLAGHSVREREQGKQREEVSQYCSMQ